MAVLHKKRNANTKKRARLMLGMAACVFAPTALAVWYLTALLLPRWPMERWLRPRRAHCVSVCCTPAAQS